VRHPDLVNGAVEILKSEGWIRFAGVVRLRNRRRGWRWRWRAGSREEDQQQYK